jgi:hypothetical protein
MKKAFLVLLILLAMFITGCGDTENNDNNKDSLVSSQVCESPPETFTWNKETYTLKIYGDKELEPGMKWGYLACNNGVIEVQKEGPNATFNIYTYGSNNKELLLVGEWGRALYRLVNYSTGESEGENSFTAMEALRLGYEEAKNHTEEVPLLIHMTSTDSSLVPQEKNDGIDGKRDSWNLTFGTAKGSIHISIEIQNGVIKVGRISKDANNLLQKGMYALSDIQIDSPEAVQKAIAIGMRPGDPEVIDDWIKGYHFSIAGFLTNPNTTDPTLLLQVTGISPNSPNSRNESLRMNVFFEGRTGKVFNANEMSGYDKDGRTMWKTIELNDKKAMR